MLTQKLVNVEPLAAGDPGGLLGRPGVARGFQTLVDNVSGVTYVIWAPHEPSAGGGVRYNDCGLWLDRPLEPTVLSTWDRPFPLLGETR